MGSIFSEIGHIDDPALNFLTISVGATTTCCAALLCSESLFNAGSGDDVILAVVE